MATAARRSSWRITGRGSRQIVFQPRLLQPRRTSNPEPEIQHSKRPLHRSGLFLSTEPFLHLSNTFIAVSNKCNNLHAVCYYVLELPLFVRPPFITDQIAR